MGSNQRPFYAHQRGTAGNFRLDVKGSDKAFNFCYRGEGERLFVFEAPIDLLSFLCLFKKDWQKQSYLALGGVGDKALMRFLSDRPNIETVYLCLDSDQAGNDACSRLVELMPEGLTVHRLIPLFKDWNEVQTRRNEITDGKYLREAVYGLKEPPQEETVEIIRMSEVDTQTVEWLWKPYIPFGKVTIVQGNPGEGKTTFALRLAAACTTGGTLPGMKPLPPFQVIYQTAEDGLGDTVKPRLMEAEADLDRVLVIDEAKRELTLSDERIEKAITQNGARLIILDPIQAYLDKYTGSMVCSKQLYKEALNHTFDAVSYTHLDVYKRQGKEDENGILFVCFPITAIAAVLSRSPMTVKRSLNELETAGLIMRGRQGIGEPNRSYVLIPGKEDAALA